MPLGTAFGRFSAGDYTSYCTTRCLVNRLQHKQLKHLNYWLSRSQNAIGAARVDCLKGEVDVSACCAVRSDH
jgi:hypothetical protein